MNTSSSTNEIQPDTMEHDHPGAAQQTQYRQEQEPSELLQTTNQRHLQRQQRIAELREKRLSMSSIMTIDTSSSAQGSSFFTCSSPTASSSSTASPMMPLPTSPPLSSQDNCPTNYHQSRRKSLSSVSSSLSEWHHPAHSNLPSNSSNPAIPVPGSVAPISAARRQQQQRTNKHKFQTSESDGPLPFPSRPNSFASSYQPTMLSRKDSQRSQQQRQLDSGTGTTLTATSSHSSNQYEKEPNAAFERICTLLNHLITDASTAVSTADSTNNMDSSGAAIIPSIVIPRYMPMVYSESENSDEDVEEASYMEGGEAMMPLEDDGIDGQESIFFDEEAHHPPESPRDQIRRRIDDSRKKRLARNRTGSYTADPSKRTSLFLELQNLQVEPEGTQHPTTPALGNLGIVDPEGSKFHHHHRHRHQRFEPTNSSSLLSPGIGIGSGQTSLEATILATTLRSPTTPSRSLDFELFDSELGSPVTLTTPRRRASFPPRRSDRIQTQRADELQWVIQRVDAELDRTVETIDDLTRDLVAVATHQNWMKAHLERILGIQSPLSLTDILQKDDDGVSSQVAGAATGETGASPMSPLSCTSPRGRLEQMEDIIGATKALLSSKEFANYYQVLERVRIMEQEEDCEDHYDRGGGVGERSDLFGGHVDTGNKQQRLSDSSFTLVNGSFRHSSSSTLSLDTRFGSYADFKDGALLTSSSRPSIEWSDRVGMTPYSNSSSHGLGPEKIHPFAAASPVHQHQHQHQHRGLTSYFEPLSTQGAEPIGDHLPKAEPDQQKQPRREQHHDTLLQTEHLSDSHLSPDAALAIDKLILGCTHLFLLLVWTVTLFLGVVITDGSILDNAGRQLIFSVEVLQSHFTFRDDSSLAEQLRDDDDATLKHEQEQEQEQLEVEVAGPVPKSSRPCSTRRRRRPSQRYHHHTHHTHHHKHLHHHRLSSIFPQINAPVAFDSVGGGSIGGRFYNSPFLASSRYGVDISNKEPRTIQLGPLSVPPVSSTTTTTTSKRLVPILPASLSSSHSCSSSVGLLEDPDLSISTACSSATLLDWLDSTATTSADKNEVQALLSVPINTDTASSSSSSSSSFLSSEPHTVLQH